MTRQLGLVDLRPLRTSPPYRRLWIGTSVSQVAHQITTVAVLYQVWQMTGSPVWTGVLGLVSAVPRIVFGLVGGALADGLNRRTLAVWTTIGQVLAALGLAAQAVADLESLPVVLGLVATQAACGSLGSPAKRTIPTRLLPRELVPSGIALQHLAFQGSMLVGPVLGGTIISQWGLAVCYTIQVAAFLIALYSIILLPSLPPLEPSEQRRRVQTAFDGVRYIVQTPVVRGSFGLDLVATLLAMPIALFPMINEIRFGGDPRTLGLFLTAVAVGGVSAGVLSGRITRADKPGMVQIWAAAAWGASLAGFGLLNPLWLALTALAVAGAADTISVISRAAIVQLATPDSHRGRVSAAEQIVGAAGPDLGNLRAGLVAGATSAGFTLVAGGLACLAGVAWIASRNRQLRNYRISQQPGANTSTPGFRSSYHRLKPRSRSCAQQGMTLEWRFT